MHAPNRAFVVEIDAGAAIARVQLHGLVEHVVSGDGDTCDPAAALVGFIERVLLPGELVGGQGEEAK